MKCKKCTCCKKGFFKSEPNKYVCTGVPEPFIINNINNKCVVDKNDNTMIEISWSKFRDDGLLWFINTILHIFGYAIVVVMENGEVIRSYPARVKYRGFSEKENTNGYKKLSQYMKENAKKLLDEASK